MRCWTPEWRGRRFTLVDTAGLDARSRRDIPGDMAALARGAQEQARLAIQEADVCCFVLDIRDGVTPLDDEVAKTLRGGGKPVLVVGNKADSDRDPHYAHELHGLGLGEPMLISALQGRDTGDLLDAMVDALPPVEDNGTGPPDARELRVAIIGRPNTGKSSLLNALVGEERALVSPVAGTTRDAVDTVVAHDGRAVRLVAGRTNACFIRDARVGMNQKLIGRERQLCAKLFFRINPGDREQSPMPIELRFPRVGEFESVDDVPSLNRGDHAAVFIDDHRHFGCGGHDKLFGRLDEFDVGLSVDLNADAQPPGLELHAIRRFRRNRERRALP